MTGPDSLTIRSARLRSKPGLADVVIRDGVVDSITSPGETGPDAVEVDAAGNLATESFVNTHLHLDKVFTLQHLGDAALAEYQSGDMGRAMSAIATAAAVKNGQDPEAMLAAGRRAAAMAAY
jgi:cytosine deaminase